MSKFDPILLDQEYFASFLQTDPLEFLTVISDETQSGLASDDPLAGPDWGPVQQPLDIVPAVSSFGDGENETPGIVVPEHDTSSGYDSLDFAISTAQINSSFNFQADVFESAWSSSRSADVHAETETDVGVGHAGAEMPTTPDLIFLDAEYFARPAGAGSGGGGGGGGNGNGGGGGEDPNVLASYLSGADESGAYTGYNIEIVFQGTWTSELQQAFIDASEYLSDVIVGDVIDVFYRGKDIDDIRIEASLENIDGTGGILGQAGPTAVRTAEYNYLPAAGIMEFDSADADSYAATGQWYDIVLHEMIHTLGFGETIWGLNGLISGANTSDPLFTGANALSVYEAQSGETGAAGVPLEGDGPEGTRDSHWDEQTFGAELMTGYLDEAGVYVSDMTIASLEDLGYDTTWTETNLIA